MGDIGLIARAEGRRRRLGLLGLAVLVALVGATVLATAAGARRTGGALDRFLAETATRDARVLAFTLGAEARPALARAVADAPGVQSSASAVLYATDAPASLDVAILTDPRNEMFRLIDRPHLLAGRLPAEDVATEVALNETAASELGSAVGDRLTVRSFSPEDCAALGAGRFEGLNSPPITLEVVGLVRLADELQGSSLQAGGIAVGSPAFVPAHGDDLCPSAVGIAVHLDEGSGTGPLQQAVLEAAPEADPVVADVGSEFVDTTRSAIDVAVTSLTVFALVAGLAGLLVVGQSVSRQVAPGPEVVTALSALGLSRHRRTVAVALPAVAACGAGVVGALLLAAAVSPWFPVGVARGAETEPGLSVDGLAFVTFAVLAVAVTSIVALVAAGRRVRNGAAAPAARGSGVVAAATRAGAGPTAAFGLRLAYERSADRSSTSARTAIVGMAVGIVGVIGVAVLTTTLAETRDAPARWGWTWSTKPDSGGDLAAEDLATIAAEPGVEAAAMLTSSSVAFGDVVVQSFALTDAEGSTTFTVTDGRLPVGPNEVALGSTTLADLGADVGDRVTAAAVEGQADDLDVVGRAVVPGIDNPNPGDGALFTPDGLADLAPGHDRALVLTYDDGVDVTALEARLAAGHDLSFPPAYAHPQEPGRLANMHDTRMLVVALGVFIGALGLAGLVHALLVSARRQQRSFAVLRSLGLRRAQVRRALAVQSLAIVVTGLAFGVPVGLAAGRVAWRAAVGDLGMVDAVTTPTAAVALVATAAVVAGVLLASLPGRIASRRRPADVLRAE